MMKRLAGEGRAVLVSSQLMSEMALTADHLVVIGKGRLLADSPIDDFIAQNARSFILIRTPEPERLRQLLIAGNIAVEEGADGTIEAVGTTQEHVGALAARHQVPVYEIRSEAASLEDAFMQLTADAATYRVREAGA